MSSKSQETIGSNETKPLVGKNGFHRQSSYSRQKTISKIKAIGMVILFGVVAVLYFSGSNEDDSNVDGTFSDDSVTAAAATAAVLATPSAITYRPFCLTHRPSTSSRILQTSMGSPNQQWSHIPCYGQSPESLRWTFAGTKPKVNLNAFGAPDAILRMNSSNIAHPGSDIPIQGFGAAFTEASALNYETLSPRGKERFMELLFGKSGLGYSLGRVHINSCDFSYESYSFDETDGDFELNDFDTGVTHDVRVGMVGMILRATSVFNTDWASEDHVDGDFKMYASPWSPPSWMKKPTWEDEEGAEHAERMTYSASKTCLREGVGPTSRYAKSWALYFSKFITAYKELGIPFWAVTVQNEPEFPAPWEACSYRPDTEGDFVAYHLGPQLEKDHPDVQIFMFDHNKDHMNHWAKILLNASHPASKYINGTAYHWYAGGMDRLLDGAVGIPNMHKFQTMLESFDLRSDHIVLGSEACHCPTTGYAGGDIENYWSRAERYAHTILADLAAGSHGWVEWNMLLDSIGGPNHVGNLCDAPILAVPHRAVNASDLPETMYFENATLHHERFGPNHGDGRTREELNALGFPAKFLDDGLAVQPIYFYMGHISRYVRPGSRAVTAIVEESINPFDANKRIRSSSSSSSFRAFRPQGQVVAGGGLNDLARNGVELTVWPCEGSTRQQFRMIHNDTRDGPNKNLKRIQVLGHDWLGKPTISCVGTKADKDFNGITLTECKKRRYGLFEIVPVVEEKQSDGDDDDEIVPENKIQIILTNGKTEKRCLMLKELSNGGGAYGSRGGAQVTFGDCSTAASHWKYSEQTGEITSMFLSEGEVCMTTGWPFLQIGAFDTPNGESEKTVVVLNEARDAANYVLYDNDEAVLSGSIPPRSIQTVLVDYH